MGVPLWLMPSLQGSGSVEPSRHLGCSTFLHHTALSRASVGFRPVLLAAGVCFPTPERWPRVSPTAEGGGQSWTCKLGGPKALPLQQGWGWGETLLLQEGRQGGEEGWWALEGGLPSYLNSPVAIRAGLPPPPPAAAVTGGMWS